MSSRPMDRDPSQITREYVIARLEEAGSTLLAMHLGRVGPSERVTAAWPEMLRDEFIDLPDPNHRIRLLPGADKITRMDEAFGWIKLVPNATYRRVLQLRLLVNPRTGKNLRTWARVARTLHADRRAVKKWHGKAVGMIVSALGGAPDMYTFANPVTTEIHNKIRVSFFNEAA